MPMEAANYQVFMSVIVIMAAAFVALVCDFLKGNNEMLREMNLELRVRREEEEKRIQLLMPRRAAEVSMRRVAIRKPAVKAAEAHRTNWDTLLESARKSAGEPALPSGFHDTR